MPDPACESLPRTDLVIFEATADTTSDTLTVPESCRGRGGGKERGREGEEEGERGGRGGRERGREGEGGGREGGRGGGREGGTDTHPHTVYNKQYINVLVGKDL